MSASYDTLNIPEASQQYTDATLGPVVVGWMVQLIMAGYVASSFAHYTQTSLWAENSRRVKAMVYVVMMLLFLQSAVSFYSNYHYTTWQIRDSNTLYAQTIIDCFSLSPVGFLGAIVQVYLSTRAAALFRSTWKKAVYMFFIAISVTGGLVGTWLYFALSLLLRAGRLDDALPMNFGIAAGMFLWCCCFADCLISVSLCVLLWQRLAVFKESQSLVRRLMIMIIKSAAYTATFAFLGAVLSYSFPDYSLNANSPVAFYLPLSSLYALSLLDTLASREKTRALRAQTIPHFRAAETLMNGGHGTIPLPLSNFNPSNATPSMASSFTEGADGRRGAGKESTRVISFTTEQHVFSEKE